MANRIKGITVEIGGNTTKLEKALTDVNKQIKTTQSNLKDVEKLLELDPANVELLSQKQSYLNEVIEETKKKLETEKEALKQLNEQNQSGELTEEQKALQREIEATEQQLKKFEDELKEFGSVFQQQMVAVGEKVKEVGSEVKKVGDELQSVGTSLTKNVTAPIVAVGTASIAAFNEVDNGIDTIIKKTGATGPVLAELEQSMKNIYGTLPVTAEEAGQAVGEVNTRFKVTGDRLEQLSISFLKFAKINDTDLVNAIDSVDFIMEKFGISSEHTAEVLDFMTKAGQDTSISMETLEGLLSSQGATLKELGFGFEESVTLLAQLEENGVDASTALTGLRAAIRNAVSEGMSSEEALQSTINAIKNAATETEALDIATELFGSRGAAELTQAIREGKISFDELNVSLDTYAGTVETTFAATQDATDEATVAMNNLKLAGAELGESILTAVQPIIESFIEKVKNATEWFKNLDDNTKQTMITIAGIAAIVGPVILILGSVTSAIGSIITVVGQLMPIIGAVVTFTTGTLIPAITALVATIGAPVVAAIGLVIAAIVTWMQNWEDIKELATIVCEWILTVVESVGIGISDRISTIIDLASGLASSLSSIFDGLISNALGWGSDLIGNIVNGITSGIDAVANAASSVASTIADFLHFTEPDKGPLSNFHTFMPDMIENLVTGIEGNLDLLDSPMNQLASALVPTADYSEITNRMDQYMPNMGSAVTVVLEGDAKNLFDAWIVQNNIYKKINGESAY